jgi:hypothetical protein
LALDLSSCYLDDDDCDDVEDGDDDDACRWAFDFCSHHSLFQSIHKKMPRAQFECACGNAFTAAAERTPDFTIDCRQCHRRVRPKASVLAAEAPRR